MGAGRLDGLVGLVTGGGSGIGAATVRRAVAEGGRVGVLDLDADAARRVCADLPDVAGIPLAADITDAAALQAAVTALENRFGGLDWVFANAAAVSVEHQAGDTDALDIDIAHWRRTLEVDLTGTLLTVRACLPHLIARGGGTVVCTSSEAVSLGEADHVAYAAAKAGVGALVRHVATRWGKQGVRANTVSPGPVLTGTPEATARDERKRALLEQVLTPRLGHPGDIAATVVHLVSPDGAWITGQTIGVSGGLVLR